MTPVLHYLFASFLVWQNQPVSYNHLYKFGSKKFEKIKERHNEQLLYTLKLLTDEMAHLRFPPSFRNHLTISSLASTYYLKGFFSKNTHMPFFYNVNYPHPQFFAFAESIKTLNTNQLKASLIWQIEKTIWLKSTHFHNSID